jgi:hypothetical protein
MRRVNSGIEAQLMLRAMKSSLEIVEAVLVYRAQRATHLSSTAPASTVGARDRSSDQGKLRLGGGGGHFIRHVHIITP